MSSLGLEFKEPYPIYRGLRIPVWDGGRPVRVRRVTDEDKRAFADAMGRLRSLLEGVSELASALKLSEAEGLGLLADAIAMFLKAPLIQEATLSAPTPLKACALSLLAPKIREGLWSEDLYKFAGRLAGLTSEELRFAEELFQSETADLVFRLWIAFPADTRPGHNTSSLIAHSLMTSAISWALERGNGAVKEDEEARLRLAALLHDLGKVVDPERHYEASEGLARVLLKGLVEEGTLEEVAIAIKEHHHIAELSQADRLASAADRLEGLVEKTIGDKLAKIEGLIRISREKDGWAFWRSVYERREELRKARLTVEEDPLRELTEEFLAKVGDLELEQEKLDQPTTSELSLVLVDVASIQDLVMRSQEVRVVAAASHVIDLAVHAHFLEYLRSKGLRVPPEAVIYAGGGNILMLLPSHMATEVERLAKEYGNAGLSLTAVSAPFYDSYVVASRCLAKRLFARKHELEPSDALDALEANGRGLCEMCYGRWATTTVGTPEKTISVCETCGRLYDVGSKHHFGPKWRAAVKIAEDVFTAEEIFKAKWDTVSRWIIEIIAGHNEELWQKEGRVERIRDYAAIKFDGNAMGRFMLEAISFTDAIERSFRIDIALKKAYFKALEALYRGVKEAAGPEGARREVVRVILGTIYMGGDDGFILAPSWASALLAHFIAEEFSRQLGLERGLRVAVAAGQARMSVWALLDCASAMMERAGDVIRREDPTAAERVLGAVAFDVFEAGSPSGASAVERMERLSRRVQGAEPLDEKVDGLQPYLIRRQDLEGSTVPEFWSKLVPLVLGLPPRSTWSDVEAYRAHVEAFARAYLTSRSEAEDKKVSGSEELKKALGDVRNAILRSWSVVSGSRYWREKLLVYLQRQEERRVKAMEEAYRRLAHFAASSLPSDGIGPVPLADALTFIKLVKGGAW